MSERTRIDGRTHTASTRRKIRVLDLCSGTGSSTEPFVARYHPVTRVEKDRQHDADIYADILDLTPDDLTSWPGHPFYEFIWASPPCTAFSVASIGHHWGGGYRAYKPKTEEAELGQKLVRHVLYLIKSLTPSWWVMENPQGVLKKLPVVRGLPRVTVDYCQYGDSRQKPTNLWGRFPEGWAPRPRCRATGGRVVDVDGVEWRVDPATGGPCHIAAERGSKTGTQGIDGAVDRSRVPYELGLSLCLAAEGNPQGEGQLMLTQEAS